MRGLIQRVTQAQVDVDGQCVGRIGQGLLVLLAVEANDTLENVARLAHKVVNYRLFSDAAGKMNRSLLDIGGGILVVSQFTLAADTRKGLRPSFSAAAPPEQARQLYEQFLAQLKSNQDIQIASGIFAADMQVALINDGPVTFLLES